MKYRLIGQENDLAVLSGPHSRAALVGGQESRHVHTRQEIIDNRLGISSGDFIEHIIQ